MNIYFIRHAESTNNVVLYLRRPLEEHVCDPGLSDLGQRQAHALGGFLAENIEEFNFNRIYISPCLRTLQTAAAFTHLYPDAPKIVWPDIHEYGGCAEIHPVTKARTGCPGMTRSEIKTQFPEYQLSEGVTDEGWYFLPGFEPREIGIARAKRVVQYLIDQFGDSEEKIAIVSHWDFHILFANTLLGLDDNTHTRVVISNTGISTFAYAADIWADSTEYWWSLVQINRCEWLTDDLQRDWSTLPN
ncbi:MAG: histidine phosphatase family protein [Anaerolineae bacterium]|nr:histidine phosphatase family protein [Anaerolineae bacterium]